MRLLDRKPRFAAEPKSRGVKVARGIRVAAERMLVARIKRTLHRVGSAGRSEPREACYFKARC